MSKQLLTLGIILSLGTVGCAGFGLQSNSSLSSRLHAERGVDTLWIRSEEGAPQGSDPTLYAEQELGELWDEGYSPEPSLADARYDVERQGDLWNSAWY